MNGWQIFVELTGRPPVEIRPGESLVGRSRTCQVHIPETTVSRQHARILSSALGEVTVEDLGSSNGTFVNGEKIEGRRKLADGDRITVGDAEMRMRIVAPVAATEATVRLTLPPLSQIAAAGAPPAMPPMPQVALPPPVASSLPADALDPWEKTPPAPLELPLEPLPAPPPAPPPASVAETIFAPSPRPGAPPPTAPMPAPAPPPASVAETIFAPSPLPGAPPPMAPSPPPPPAHVGETIVAPSPRPGAPPMAPPPRPAQVAETIVAPTARPGAPPLPVAPPPAAPMAATVAAPPRVMAAPPSPARTIDPPLQTAPKPGAPPARKDALPSVTAIDRIPIPEPPAYVLEAAKLERARPAGFWIRVAAALVDAIPAVVVTTIGTVLGFVVHPMLSVLTNLLVLPYSFYVGLYMPATQGTTIGKKMLGLRIVHPSVKPGAGLGWGVALLRAVGHMVCAFTLGIGYLLVAFTSQKQGLHDLIASTRVVRVR